jgi:hypothetical protein
VARGWDEASLFVVAQVRGGGRATLACAGEAGGHVGGHPGRTRAGKGGHHMQHHLDLRLHPGAHCAAPHHVPHALTGTAATTARATRATCIMHRGHSRRHEETLARGSTWLALTWFRSCCLALLAAGRCCCAGGCAAHLALPGSHQGLARGQRRHAHVRALRRPGRRVRLAHARLLQKVRPRGHHLHARLMASLAWHFRPELRSRRDCRTRRRRPHDHPSTRRLS